VFTPTPNDIDGLSVYLESERFGPEELRGLARNPDNFYVVRVPVIELTRLGLTAIPKDDVNNPGHCVIPEFTYPAYQANKAAWRPVQTALLAVVAGKYL
jgi:hypothetical protein